MTPPDGSPGNPEDPLELVKGIVEQLEAIAQQLREGELPDTEAAELIDECATLAAQATTALDDSLAGQDRLGI